jgi:hypothetical protein
LLFQHFERVTGATFGQSIELVAARRAGRYDHGLRRVLSKGQQSEVGDLHTLPGPLGAQWSENAFSDDNFS